jgi:signal transduction histidine kinase
MANFVSHPKRWAKIIEHLIDNAIKFTPEGSVKILSECSGETDHSIIIEDTGIGMSQEYLKKLFLPFSQEDHGTSRKFDGNGLGLALVQHCCDLNKAQIMVESTKGLGTRFTVKFQDLHSQL